MSNDPYKSIQRLDSILPWLVGFSLAIPTAVSQIDLPYRGLVIWIPAFSFLILMIIKILGYLVITLPEMAFVERVKAWNYFIFLIITFLSNFLLIIVLPHSMNSYLLGITLVPIFLIVSRSNTTKKLFYNELLYMNPKQDKMLSQLLTEVGSASIMYSMCVINLLSLLLNNNAIFMNVLLTSIISTAFFIYALYRDRKAKKNSVNLVESLINSRWFIRYSGKQV
jgi:hypothetical protein